MTTMTTPDIADSAVAALAALGQKTRLQVFQTLVEAGTDGLAAGAIADRLDVKQNTLSTHLNILERSGMVVRRREGRSLIYRPSFFGVRQLVAYLMHDCCKGHPAVCKPIAASLTATS